MPTRRLFIASATAFALAPQARAQTGRLPVVASFSIVADVALAVGGGRIALTTLVKPGVDGHVYAPTPADARTVGEARIVIVNGLKFEAWMTRLIQSSGSKAVIVEAAMGVKTLKDRGGHAHGHSHGHAAVDPHAWQSAANMKIYAANIRDALTAADPSGKADYEANAARYIGELDQLDRDIKAAVARIPPDRRKVITSHDAFAYFQDAYGVQFIAPRGISTASEASAKDVARIVQQIRREKIAAVFIENINDPRLIQQIAAESGARVGGALFSDALSAPDGPAPTYIQMMRHNIRVISEALSPVT
jgi:zinc/manganese transport system substrate-binding protein